MVSWSESGKCQPIFILPGKNRKRFPRQPRRSFNRCHQRIERFVIVGNLVIIWQAKCLQNTVRNWRSCRWWFFDYCWSDENAAHRIGTDNGVRARTTLRCQAAIAADEGIKPLQTPRRTRPDHARFNDEVLPTI